MTPNSFVMKNATSKTLLNIAQHTAPSNNESGVLQIIEQNI
ncbi:hypothetical protein RT41_GL001443 [Lactococcus fujiensis JCM 16395]|uniref:Uncharacterized protein n=1 Tax=Lactococcus fujiensis JCM 16395 TaxID=1291764 RepID=A0A2A5RLF6_9LACT|nr:hypothetical protein RT41_GL001443 [Lactococcus fujiensis JCM 16395]